MEQSNRIKPLLIALSLCCAAPLSAADAEPLLSLPSRCPGMCRTPSLRVPVKVDVTAALLRMPPQVYLADLKPLEITGGLAFDPQTKSAIRHDIRKPKEKAATIAKEKERYKKARTSGTPKPTVDCTKKKAARSCGSPARRRTPSSRSTNTFPPGQRLLP